MIVARQSKCYCAHLPDEEPEAQRGSESQSIGNLEFLPPIGGQQHVFTMEVSPVWDSHGSWLHLSLLSPDLEGDGIASLSYFTDFSVPVLRRRILLTQQLLFNRTNEYAGSFE
jgi:hypothetical protein